MSRRTIRAWQRRSRRRRSKGERAARRRRKRRERTSPSLGGARCAAAGCLTCILQELQGGVHRPAGSGSASMVSCDARTGSFSCQKSCITCFLQQRTAGYVHEEVVTTRAVAPRRRVCKCAGCLMQSGCEQTALRAARKVLKAIKRKSRNHMRKCITCEIRRQTLAAEGDARYDWQNLSQGYRQAEHMWYCSRLKRRCGFSGIKVGEATHPGPKSSQKSGRGPQAPEQRKQLPSEKLISAAIGEAKGDCLPRAIAQALTSLEGRDWSTGRVRRIIVEHMSRNAHLCSRQLGDPRIEEPDDITQTCEDEMWRTYLGRTAKSTA